MCYRESPPCLPFIAHLLSTRVHLNLLSKFLPDCLRSRNESFCRGFLSSQSKNFSPFLLKMRSLRPQSSFIYVCRRGVHDSSNPAQSTVSADDEIPVPKPSTYQLYRRPRVNPNILNEQFEVALTLINHRLIQLFFLG